MRQIATLLLAVAGATSLHACDDGLQPVPFQGISGAVSFVGVAPDSTEWVRVAVYRDVPANPFGFLDLVAFSDTLSLATDTARYAIALDPGQYALVVAFWKRLEAPLTELRVAGWHSVDSTAFGPPEPTAVEAEAESGGVDLVVRYDSLLSLEDAVETLP